MPASGASITRLGISRSPIVHGSCSERIALRVVGPPSSSQNGAPAHPPAGQRGRPRRGDVALGRQRKAERRGRDQRRAGAALDQPPRGVPLPEGPRRRRAPCRRRSRRPGASSVRAGVQQPVDQRARRRRSPPSAAASRRVLALEPARSRPRPPRRSTASVSVARGRWPGQSVRTCRSVRCPSGRACASDGSAASAARRPRPHPP